MEQTQTNMMPEKQLITNLKELGFEEIKTNLYAKKISENTMLYRDYRNAKPSSYAYFKDRKIHPTLFRETRVINKIELTLKEQDTSKLTAYA